MEEMLQVAGGLSGRVQQEFFDTAVRLAELLRGVLEKHNLIIAVPRDHKSAWGSVKNKLTAHVDDGVANIPALGAAPIAIRVGTYMVRPGRRGDDRESFRISSQLVDERLKLQVEACSTALHPDLGAVREVAQMASEAAGASLTDEPIWEFPFTSGEFGTHIFPLERLML
jgi:hypothetical protein